MNRPSSMLTMCWFISTVVIIFTFTCGAAEVLRDGQGSDVVKLFVTEGDNVILPCFTRPNVNIEKELCDWKKDNKEVFMFYNGNYYGNGLSGQDQDFKGRVSHFDEELKKGNASILLRDTRTTDSGNYTCIFPHLGSGQTYRIELVVEMTFKNRLGQIEGAAPPPYVKIRNVTGDGVLLECWVPGAFPKPRVEWQTSDGIVVPADEPQVSLRGHRFDVLLLTTVKKTTTNMYRCVVKQEGFGHVIHNELLVPDKLFEDKSSLIITLKVSLVIVIALLVIAILVIIIMNHRKKLLKLWSTCRDAERGSTQSGHPLNNGSGSTQTTLLR